VAPPYLSECLSAYPQELGQTREVSVLWLLTLSAPKASFDEKRIAAIANTLVVP
tara:strand:- start:311 stop:472 length:162 start_codon:yes stop_codon:yes gene_type:complete